jgi:hypothetical protein
MADMAMKPGEFGLHSKESKKQSSTEEELKPDKWH